MLTHSCGDSNKDNIFIDFRTVGDAGPYNFLLRRLLHRHLRRIQHIFDKNAVSRGGIVDEHVGHSSYELAVL